MINENFYLSLLLFFSFFSLLTESPEICLDTYAYLIFMRGICLRHLNQLDDAIDCFHDVLSCKKRLQYETHLLPQACFELGSIHRTSGNLVTAKKWLKKARDDYSNYLTEVMIQYRSSHLLKCIKMQLEENNESLKD